MSNCAAVEWSDLQSGRSDETLALLSPKGYRLLRALVQSYPFG